MASSKKISKGSSSNASSLCASSRLNHDVYCYCKKKCTPMPAKTEDNYGRIFVSCPKWTAKTCDFFRWVDELKFVEDEDEKMEMEEERIIENEAILCRLGAKVTNLEKKLVECQNELKFEREKTKIEQEKAKIEQEKAK